MLIDGTIFAFTIQREVSCRKTAMSYLYKDQKKAYNSTNEYFWGKI